MAPSFRPSKNRSSRDDEDFFEARGDRKARKPLVEKKRRARINESLQELRLILADTETKMENAEVLELTVRRVQGILQSSSLGNLSTPRIDETGPTSIQSYVFTISSAEPDWYYYLHNQNAPFLQATHNKAVLLHLVL
ncbi:Transcription cofactor HES-6 [Varanus komodoensis]|nr:Transcription cofactor HES-6 [Varanus komodoensis]